MDFLKSVCWLYLAHPHQPIHIHKHEHIHTRSRLRRTNHSESSLCPYHTCDIIDYWAYASSRYTRGRIYTLCTKCGNTGDPLPSIQWNGWMEHTSRARIGCTALGKFENSHLPFANTNRLWRARRSVYIHSRQHGFAANYRCRMCADMRTQGNHSPIERATLYFWMLVGRSGFGSVQEEKCSNITSTHTYTLILRPYGLPSQLCRAVCAECEWNGIQGTRTPSFNLLIFVWTKVVRMERLPFHISNMCCEQPRYWEGFELHWQRLMDAISSLKESTEILI